MTTDKVKTVFDLADLGGPVYIGRAKGEKARDRWHLDEIDKGQQSVIVKIPGSTFSMNSSFFLGLFGKSIKHAHTREAFREKYQFSMPDIFEETVESCIVRALHEKQPLIDN